MEDQGRGSEFQRTVTGLPQGILGPTQLFANAKRRYRRRQVTTRIVAIATCSVLAVGLVAKLQSSQPLKVVTVGSTVEGSGKSQCFDSSKTTDHPSLRSATPQTTPATGAPQQSDRPSVVATVRLPLVDAAPLVLDPWEVVATPDAVWTANLQGTVSRIDPHTCRVVATIHPSSPDAGPRSIVSAGGAIWVGLQNAGKIVRIDPIRNVVTDTIATGNRYLFQIASTGDALWITGAPDGTVKRLDVATRKITDSITVGATDGTIAATSQDVWVASENQSSDLTRIDPRLRRVTDHIALPGNLAYSNGHSLAANGQSVWATVTPAAVVRIDRVSKTVTTTALPEDPGAVSASSDSVWVSLPGSVVHLNAASRTITATVLVSDASASAIEGRTLWVISGRRLVVAIR